MRLLASTVGAVTGGALAGPDVEVEGASIDSRSAPPGSLFVPIVSERDGHDFIDGALDAGAAATLSSRPGVGRPGRTTVAVDDTAVALSRLGAHARSLVPDRVVGVTGSVGKTSVKDLLAAALAPSFRTSASERSFNNTLGVPLTLLNAPDGAEAVVVEMGARGIGHIAELCAVARPTIGVVTSVELGHTEMFGSLAEVALGKGELVEALSASGTAVLAADAPLVAAMAERTEAAVVGFGIDRGDVRAERVRLDGELRPRFRLVSPWGRVEVTLEARGRHQVLNALAAAAAALAAGASLGAVAEGLAGATLSPWRMDLGRAASGTFVLNDAYNANPASMRVALASLAELTASRRVAVLGVMAELGVHHGEEHAAVAGGGGGRG